LSACILGLSAACFKLILLSCPIGLQLLPLLLRKRTIYLYKDYFRDFYDLLTWKVQKKVLWTLEVIESLDRIPEIYFKHLTNTNGLYEIRIQVGGNIYRIFCFFDDHNLIVVGNGFQKKTQKTPKQEIEIALTIKKQYHEEKKSDPAE
jgi:phage-related protein